MTPEQVVDGVEVWYAVYSQLLPRLADLEGSLSEGELQRAGRYRQGSAGLRFRAGRGFLRTVLAGYLGIPPGEISLITGDGGKPMIAGGTGATGLRFNVSHSNDLLCVAASWDREVGVDVERIRPLRRERDIVERFLSPTERREWEDAAPAARQRTFHQLWTRREALLKGQGAGFIRPPRQGDRRVTWRLHQLRTPAGYAGALAVCMRPVMGVEPD